MTDTRPKTATAPLRTVVVEWCDCGAGYEAREPDAVVYGAWLAAHVGHRDEGEA